MFCQKFFCPLKQQKSVSINRSIARERGIETERKENEKCCKTILSLKRLYLLPKNWRWKKCSWEWKSDTKRERERKSDTYTLRLWERERLICGGMKERDSVCVWERERDKERFSTIWERYMYYRLEGKLESEKEKVICSN